MAGEAYDHRARAGDSRWGRWLARAALAGALVFGLALTVLALRSGQDPAPPTPAPTVAPSAEPSDTPTLPPLEIAQVEYPTPCRPRRQA